MSKITVVLGTGATIVPADTLFILASQLRPVQHHDTFFKNTEIIFIITAPLVAESNTVVLQGSTVIDPCSSVVITALFDSPRELTYNWSSQNDAILNFAISKERKADIQVAPSTLQTPGKSYIILVSVTNFLGFSWSSLPFELLFDASESLKIAILPLFKTKFDFTDDIEILTYVQFSSCKSPRNDIAYRWSIENTTETAEIAQTLAAASGPRIFVPANLFAPNIPNVVTVTALGGFVSARSSITVWVSPPPLPVVEILGCVASASVSQTFKMPISIL
jgi:hypothetical protein